MREFVATAFGRVLRRLRQAASLSQEALAMEAGLQRNYISSLELGEKQPSITSVFKLASALDIKASVFVALVEGELDA